MRTFVWWSAAASLFVSVQAVAQAIPEGSSVMLYGLLDAGVSYVSNESGSKNLKFDDAIATPNLLIFKGSEDLGDGLHAVFTLANQYVLGTGAILAGRGIFGANAFVGLASDRYGTLTLGNQYDFMTDSLLFGLDDAALTIGGLYNFRAGPFNKISIPGNPPFAAQFDWDRMEGATVNSSVKYLSPTIGGVRLGFLYGFGGIPGSFGTGDSVSLGANYDAGPFGAGVAYTEVKYASAGSPSVGIRNWGVGAHYQFENWTATALITTVRNTSNGGAIADAELGAAYMLAADWQIGADYMYMKGDAYLNNNHAHQLNGIVRHLLSKRTAIYGEIVYQRTNSRANALIDGVLDPGGTSSGPSQSIGRIGVQTRF